MSRKQSTSRNIKAAGRVAATTGRGAVKATRFTVVHWHGLLPLLCLAASGVFAAAASAFAWLYGPWAWAWTGAAAVLLFVWADSWVGDLEPSDMPPALGLLYYTPASSAVLIIAGARVEAYLLVALATLAVGIWWWTGGAYWRHKKIQREQRRMERVLSKLGVSSSTRVTSVKIDADRGDVEWRLYLGDHDRADQIKREDVAHMLKTDVSCVVVRRVESGSTRSLKIVLLASAPSSAKSAPHPAATPAGRAEGTAWAPGVRSVADGAPIGPVVSQSDQTSIFHVYRPDYGALHNLIAGMTGSGKSVTVGSVIAHCVASGDCVVAGVDLVKGGETFMPWHEAGAMTNLLYLDADAATDPTALLAAARDLLNDLAWLRTLVAQRTAQMASGQVLDADGDRTRIWPASPDSPVIVYLFEEYASTISAIEKLDPVLAEDIAASINDVARTARSSGISINIVTQKPTHEELPTALRGQLNQTILHRLKAANDLGRLWGEYDIDPIRTLASGKGLCYVDAPGGADPALTKAHDLSKPKVCAQIAAAYAASRPVVAWGGRSVTEPPEAARPSLAVLEGGSDAIDLLADAIEATDEIPAGAGIISGAAPTEDGDDERQAAIIEALAEAEGGLSRAEVERLLDTSTSAAKRVLWQLVDEGQVVKVGKSRATRYKLNSGVPVAA